MAADPAPPLRPSTNTLLLLLLAAAAASLGAATDHIVGGHLGWNPNVDYTPWLNNQTFYVGDLISFRYQKFMYNVFEVNKTGYDNCTIEGALGNWTKGKDFIPLDEPGRYYFICNGFCLQGMKVTILVHPFPSPPSHSLHHGSSNSTASAATLPLLGRSWTLPFVVTTAAAAFLVSLLL